MALQAMNLRVNLLSEPLGIDSPEPEFSWQLLSDRNSVLQSAYEIQVSSEQFTATTKLIWNSGVIISAFPWSTQYTGSPLASCSRYFWRVRLYNHSGNYGSWSQNSWFETAFLIGSSELSAHWVTRKPIPKQSEDRDVLYFRHKVDVPDKILRARLYATSLGWYKFFINGVNIVGRQQVPRWTPFHHSIEYQVYDVTVSMREGHNILGAIVADGHFRGENGGLGHRNCYGNQLAFFCLLVIELQTGEHISCSTDESWTVSTGHIVRSDPKAGEVADFTISSDWEHVGDNASKKRSWEAIEVLQQPTMNLIAEETGRVDEIRRLPAKKSWWSSSGKNLIDFGQNFSGYVRIKLHGKRGNKAILTYSEVLTPDGELDIDYIEPVGKGQPQRDEVILSGSDCDFFEPMFSTHGFRYLEIIGIEELVPLSDVEGVVVSSQLGSITEFKCSDSRLERLYKNTVWSFLSNFTDTPTDCPTRERSGWTGDLQIFSATAVLMASDVQSFLRRYLRNLSTEQWADGRIPPFIPSGDSEFSGVSFLSKLTASSVGWGDVSVLLPWLMYEHFGDTAILERQYTSMKLWVRFLEDTAKKNRSWTRWLWGCSKDIEQYIVDTRFHWGEWLRPGETGLLPMLGNLFLWPNAAVPTAYFAESSRILSKAAELLGYIEDARYFKDLALSARAAWGTAFVREGGSRIGYDKQDDYVRAIKFGMLSEREKQAAVDRLVELVEKANHHLGTGFLSTGDLVPILCEAGRVDTAFSLLLQNSSPSWLHAVDRGATTIWESWEGYTPDGKASLSHNHYALGAISGWFISGLVGLRAETPGWRHILIAPQTGGSIAHAQGAIEIPFGKLACSWRHETGGSTVKIDLQIPPGTSATLRMGPCSIPDIGSGHHRFLYCDQENKLERT